MAGVDAPVPTGVVVRKLALTFVGVLLFAAGLTLMFESMRAVMEVGGYCASGGPYEIRQECPEGAGLMVVGIFAGLIGTGLVVAGTFRNGPRLWTLAWPALFLALGWNFLEYGIDPPPPEDGPVWGWLICAVAFLAMGGLPLLFLLWKPRLTFWGTDAAPAAAPAPVAARVAGAGTPNRPTTVRFGSTTVTAPPEPAHHFADALADEADLVTDLERLAVLHRDGALSADEFARAKAARLAEEDA